MQWLHLCSAIPCLGGLHFFAGDVESQARSFFFACKRMGVDDDVRVGGVVDYFGEGKGNPHRDHLGR